jgi:hypothetical protein
MPSVAMSGLMRALVTKRPLISPTVRPIAVTTTSARGTRLGSPCMMYDAITAVTEIR